MQKGRSLAIAKLLLTAAGEHGNVEFAGRAKASARKVLGELKNRLLVLPFLMLGLAHECEKAHSFCQVALLMGR